MHNRFKLAAAIFRQLNKVLKWTVTEFFLSSQKELEFQRTIQILQTESPPCTNPALDTHYLLNYIRLGVFWKALKLGDEPRPESTGSNTQNWMRAPLIVWQDHAVKQKHKPTFSMSMVKAKKNKTHLDHTVLGVPLFLLSTLFIWKAFPAGNQTKWGDNDCFSPREFNAICCNLDL